MENTLVLIDLHDIQRHRKQRRREKEIHINSGREEGGRRRESYKRKEGEMETGGGREDGGGRLWLGGWEGG